MSRKLNTVLYVEDEENDVELMRIAFLRAGCSEQLHVVRNGDTAILYLKGGKEFADRQKHPLPDLILLDLKLPGLSGFDILSWIRGRRDFADRPVVVYTSSPLKEDADRAKMLGADYYWVKPNSSSGLLEAVQKLLDGTCTRQR